MGDTMDSDLPSSGKSDLWNQRYREGNTPWDSGIVPPELRQLVASGLLRSPGLTFDLGCGTGTNVNYLSGLGFTAYGVDLALVALVEARRKALSLALPARYCVGDVADLGFFSRQGVFALDMGCLHNLVAEDRTRYVSSLAGLLLPGALYLLYGFDAAQGFEGGASGFVSGEIANRFSRHFRMLWRRPSLQGERPVAWYLLRRL